MNTTKREIIREELLKMSQKESPERLAERADVSNVTIRKIIEGNYARISEGMFLKIKTNLGIGWGWQSAETRNLITVNNLALAAKERSMSICISHDAGTGKSHAYKQLVREYNNVILIECKNYWTKRSFCREQLRACGLDASGTTEQMIEKFMNHLKTLHQPLVIFDQFDKLKDPQLDLFMDYYNELDEQCGFILSGVPSLKKRIERGCMHDKSGYRELRSRIGRKYIALDKITRHDVEKVCIANGVTHQDVIDNIWTDCEGDMRRVRRGVEQYFLIQNDNKTA